MRERFKEFALSLHPEKTRLIEFGRHATANREKRGIGKPASNGRPLYVADCLANEHIC